MEVLRIYRETVLKEGTKKKKYTREKMILWRMIERGRITVVVDPQKGKELTLRTLPKVRSRTPASH